MYFPATLRMSSLNLNAHLIWGGMEFLVRKRGREIESTECHTNV